MCKTGLKTFTNFTFQGRLIIWDVQNSVRSKKHRLFRREGKSIKDWKEIMFPVEAEAEDAVIWIMYRRGWKTDSKARVVRTGAELRNARCADPRWLKSDQVRLVNSNRIKLENSYWGEFQVIRRPNSNQVTHLVKFDEKLKTGAQLTQGHFEI